MTSLSVAAESWPIQGSFAISRGARTVADVVVVELSDGDLRGRGECVPYARYDETVDSVLALIGSLSDDIAGGLDRVDLQSRLPAGAARNALDCAFWDLEAKREGRPAWQLAGLEQPVPVDSAYTLSLDTPEVMAQAAANNATRPLLKLKLAGPGDLERVEAVRAAAAEPALIVDANEGWSVEDYGILAPKLAELGVTLIEQPLPAGEDSALAGLDRPVPVCADESCHDRASLAGLQGRYDCINIKLDKTGGLTEALSLRYDAERAGFQIMVGCMLATSLAMAPATLLAQGVAVVDLDGPLLLAKDRDDGLEFAGSTVHPPTPALWG